jgi:hypothetical protein
MSWDLRADGSRMRSARRGRAFGACEAFQVIASASARQASAQEEEKHGGSLRS